MVRGNRFGSGVFAALAPSSNVPSGLSGGVDGGGDIGDERSGARKTCCDRAGLRQGCQPRRAADRLGICVWQLKRLGRAYRAEGDARLVSRQRGRPSNRRLARVGERLRIELINALTPQAKGHVEPANQTLQDRLVREMRLRGMDNGRLATAQLRARVAPVFPPPPTGAPKGHSYCAQSRDICILRCHVASQLSERTGPAQSCGPGCGACRRRGRTRRAFPDRRRRSPGGRRRGRRQR